MTEKCTCGATPPEDAQFCHKCGRPLREIPNLEPESESQPEAELPLVALPESPPRPPDINFRNRIAVRTGLMAALVCSLLIYLPLPAYVSFVRFIVVLVAAGFGAVWLYGKRTGEELSVRKGARMGWMTGVFCFAPAAVITTVAILSISGDNEFSEAFRDQIAAQGAGGMDPEEALSIIVSPAGVVFMLVLLFLFFTALPTVGGAMGAKVLEKE